MGIIQPTKITSEFLQLSTTETDDFHRLPIEDVIRPSDHNDVVWKIGVKSDHSDRLSYGIQPSTSISRLTDIITFCKQWMTRWYILVQQPRGYLDNNVYVLSY
uniref:Uncharacterized protein n=1 Tax=Romanomermis culicivorax TaxID=13658 RepID=A0A915L2R6_ROMCU